jgi:hypothetical protein
MTPGHLADAEEQFLLLNCRHRHGPALCVAVLPVSRQARR